MVVVLTFLGAITEFFSEDISGNKGISFTIEDIFGNDFDQGKLLESNLSLSFQYSSDVETFEAANSAHYEDGFLTTELVEGR